MFVGEEKHWDEAQAHCWGMGGELLSIKDMETMNYIKKKLYSKELGWSNNGVWNGASDLRNKGWEWTTGMLSLKKIGQKSATHMHIKAMGSV